MRARVNLRGPAALRCLFPCVIVLLLAAGCATLPPGADYPKTASAACTFFSVGYDSVAKVQRAPRCARHVINRARLVAS